MPTDIERADPAFARRVCEKYLPNPESRRPMLMLLATLIDYASGYPDKWGVTLYRDKVALNVGGRHYAFYLRRWSLEVYWIFGVGDEPPGTRDSFARIPGARGITGTAEELVPWLDRLLPRMEVFVKQANLDSKSSLILPAQRSHSPGVLRYLEEELGVSLPDPVYPKTSGASPGFTWIPFFAEIAEHVLTYRDRQDELLAVVEKLQNKGRKVVPLNDQNPEGQIVPLTVHDPFTFFTHFCRAITFNNKIALLTDLKEEWDLTADIPSDLHGVPDTNNQNAWFFAYEFRRQPTDIDRLWNIAEQAVEGLEAITEEAWQDALEIRQVALTKLTMGLFWLNPEEFLPLDRNVRGYLQRVGVSVPDNPSLEQYRTLINDAQAQLGKSLPEISYEAFKNTPLQQTRYWRVGTREGRIDRWPTMRDGGFTSIGWSELGDLKKLIAGLSEDEARNAIKEQLITIGVASSSLPSYVGPWYRFVEELSVDDVVVAMDGQRLLGIGTVTGEYEFDSEDNEQSHHRGVKWIWEGSEVWQDYPGRLTTLHDFTKDSNAVKFINDHLAATSSTVVTPPSEPTMTYPLNTIFYGPPGTGKTYETARRAVEIIDGTTPEDRKELMARYKELQRSGRIGFVTFHQSYAYEDFVEGIRPVMEEEEADGSPRYRIVDGILKELATSALGMALETPPSDQDPHTSFATVWALLEEQVIEHPQRTYKGLTDATEFRIDISATGGISGQNIKNPAMTSLLHTSQQRLEAVWNAYAVTEDKISSAQVHKIFVSNGHHFFTAALFNELKRISKSLPPETPVIAPSVRQKAHDFLQRGGESHYTLQATPPRFVLIVDEINRGNISKILGELITLLEDDKRIGQENELTVTLPYSRQPFALPPNLYLIGTMNTADKSLALLDVALRRRFTFQELPPDFSQCAPKLSSEIRKTLEELNRRIVLRKDRDHRIGHAFFMKVGDSADAFNTAFTGKVLPLLQEYFFNDWDGLRYVLGETDETETEGFIHKLKGGQDKSARNRWQWYTDTDAGETLNPLEQLGKNYGKDPTS